MATFIGLSLVAMGGMDLAIDIAEGNSATDIALSAAILAFGIVILALKWGRRKDKN